MSAGSSSAAATAVTTGAAANHGHENGHARNDRVPAQTLDAPATSKVLPNGLVHTCCEVPSRR